MWGVLFYANNESKSALARELGDCSDNKWKLAKLVFACLENFLFIKKIPTHRYETFTGAWGFLRIYGIAIPYNSVFTKIS